MTGARYAMTFEFASRPPLTARGTVAGSSGATDVVQATEPFTRPVGWLSLCYGLLGRLDAPDGAGPAFSHGPC